MSDEARATELIEGSAFLTTDDLSSPDWWEQTDETCGLHPDCEIGLLKRRLGDTQSKEYALRKKLLTAAKQSQDSEERCKAREILLRVYNLKVYTPAELDWVPKKES